MKRNGYLPLLAFMLLLSLGLGSCVIKDNDYYDPPPPSGYQYVFNEEFSNDTRGWTFDDRKDSAYALVANGYYKMVDYSWLGSNHVAVVRTGVNTNRDFLIQTRMETDYAIGLIFGASPNSYGYSFFIDDAGYFAVYKEGVRPEALVNWQYSSNILQGWNDVEVEQTGGYWYFYVNGVKVYQTPARVLSGSETGFMVLSNTTGYVDYLTLKW